MADSRTACQSRSRTRTQRTVRYAPCGPHRRRPGRATEASSRSASSITAIREVVADLNAKIMRKLAVSRDRPAGAQGATRSALSHCRMEAVPGGARLSRRDRRPLLLGAVPPDSQEVEARVTDRTVEILHKGFSPAMPAPTPARHTTIAEQMPSAHRRYASRSPRFPRIPTARIGSRAARADNLRVRQVDQYTACREALIRRARCRRGAIHSIPVREPRNTGTDRIRAVTDCG